MFDGGKYRPAYPHQNGRGLPPPIHQQPAMPVPDWYNPYVRPQNQFAAGGGQAVQLDQHQQTSLPPQRYQHPPAVHPHQHFVPSNPQPVYAGGIPQPQFHSVVKRSDVLENPFRDTQAYASHVPNTSPPAGPGSFHSQAPSHLGENRSVQGGDSRDLFASRGPPTHAELNLEEDDQPLLDELGIYPEDILCRMTSVLLFKSLDQELLVQLDLTGPVLILLTLGCTLLLAGKAHFGYVYALSTGGSLALWALLNLMSNTALIDVYRTLSILGYSLLPILVVSTAAIFLSLKSTWGLGLSAVTIVWSTATASRFFESALDLRHQRFLVAYPIFLFYATFVLLTVF